MCLALDAKKSIWGKTERARTATAAGQRVQGVISREDADVQGEERPRGAGLAHGYVVNLRVLRKRRPPTSAV